MNYTINIRIKKEYAILEKLTKIMNKKNSLNTSFNDYYPLNFTEVKNFL